MHGRVFDTRLQFNIVDRTLCRAANPDGSLSDHDRETARYRRKHVDIPPAESDEAWSEKARELVWSLLPTRLCPVHVVARHLGQDRRTLHRHLQEDEPSFAEICDEISSDLAIEYLADWQRLPRAGGGTGAAPADSGCRRRRGGMSARRHCRPAGRSLPCSPSDRRGASPLCGVVAGRAGRAGGIDQGDGRPRETRRGGMPWSTPSEHCAR